MKTVYKNGITRLIQDKELQQYKDAGWTTQVVEVLQVESNTASTVIEPEGITNLKAPKTVKSKGTVDITLDNAIESKGD
jgi:hypothetical protein